MDGKSVEAGDLLVTKALVRLRGAKPDMTDTRDFHMCSRDRCNPESEQQLISKKLLEGPPVTSNVFLCRFGVVHVCTADSCEHYQHSNTHTCPLSGFQLGTITSSYQSNDPKSWYSKPDYATSTTIKFDSRALLKSAFSPEQEEDDDDDDAEDDDGQKNKKRKAAVPAKKKHLPRVLSQSEIEARASAMVRILLYSGNRTRRNEVAIETMKTQASEAKLTYTAQQTGRRQLPFWTDVYRLGAFFLSQKLPLQEFVFSAATHDYYVNIICQVWHKVLCYYVPEPKKEYKEDGVTEIAPRVDFESVALGVLYMMRKGLKIDDVIILPQDDFLLLNLPIVIELSTYFNLRKNKITKGSDILTQTYENAIRENVPLTDLIIDVNKLPSKLHDEAHIVYEAKQVPAKMTSSGEKLFMPVSRVPKKKRKTAADERNSGRTRPLVLQSTL